MLNREQERGLRCFATSIYWIKMHNITQAKTERKVRIRVFAGLIACPLFFINFGILIISG